MQKFTFSDQDRDLLFPVSQQFQMAVADLASRQFNVVSEGLTGIFKYEGGVRVHNCAIAIKDGYVMDDWQRGGRDASPEEMAVAKAIEDVAALVRSEGIDKVLGPYKNREFHGDPLRSLFRME